MPFGQATLINWAWVTVTPIDVAGSPTDALAGVSTVRQTYGAPVRLKMQADEGLEWSRFRDGGSGATVDHQAVVSCRIGDAAALGYAPQTGDRIIRVEERNGTVWPVNVYVQEAFRDGAWTGGASLWAMRLTDGSPAKRPQ